MYIILSLNNSDMYIQVLEFGSGKNAQFFIQCFSQDIVVLASENVSKF